jgi:hypothetical protein
MHITSFGCSFIFGTELADDGRDRPIPTPSQFTWPALIARNLKADYTCLARGGSGNLAILDKVLTRCYYYPTDFFVIGWTFIDRFDYSDPAGRHFDNGPADYLTARPGEPDSVSEFYFRNIHSEHRDKITNLIYIKTAIDQLLLAGSKFLMTAIDPAIFCQRWHAPPHIIKLQEELRPYIHDFEGRNFLDWSCNRGYEITPAGHPKEQAHAAAAELMLPRVHDLLNNKNNLS